MKKTLLPVLQLAVASVFACLIQVAPAQFVHPGGLSRQADFDRMAAKVAANEQPWKGSYDRMIRMPHAQTTWGWRPVEKIIRNSNGGNFARSQQDALAIYLNALRWRITGDSTHANKAIEGMDAWSGTMVHEPGDDSNSFLASGICGWEFAMAGETLRGYGGWSQASIEAYKSFLNFFGNKAEYFVHHHLGRHGSHYRTNWDSANLSTMAAVAVFCDDQERFNRALDIYRGGGIGNANLFNGVWYLHPEGLAQMEESGRDQAHCIGGLGNFVILAEIAWNQGVDLYGYDDNRLLKALEYVNKYNVFNDGVPYEPFFGGVWPALYDEPVISPQTRGNLVPYLEVAYGHYCGRQGLAATYTDQAASLLRPSGDIGNWNSPDYFGFDSLTHYREPAATDFPPSGVKATTRFNAVTLQWTGSVRATGYNIKRSAVSGGPYTSIGFTSSVSPFYTDTTADPQTTCYYVVSAVTPAGETPDSLEAKAQALETYYCFEGNAGDLAGTRDATLRNGATFTVGKGVGLALDLDGIDDYVELPPASATQQDITISAWVYWQGGGNWQRIFDFGTQNQQRSMFLTPSNGSKMRFSISTGARTSVLDAPIPQQNTWIHVAVSLKGDVGTLYVNGAPAATRMVEADPMFGQPVGYIGKSLYADPHFKGRIDDFRIHNYGLSGAQVHALWGEGGINAAPVFSSQILDKPDATEDAAYIGQTLDGNATDANGDELTYSKLSGPAWLSIAASGALSGTPTNDHVGSNHFVVRASDPAGATDDANLHINIANVNDPPAWSGGVLTRPAVTRGQPYRGQTLASSASDEDIRHGDDFLTFSKVSGPAWLGVDGNGVLTGAPAEHDVGSNVFTVRVSDTAGASSDASLTIEVLPHMLRSHHEFENNATDSVSALDGTVVGEDSYSSGRIGQGLSLNGTSSYVTLPAAAADYHDFTVSAWVRWNGGANWQRIFDFGNGTTEYMFLTPSHGGGMRFAIRNGGSEQVLNHSAPLATGSWVHVAVSMDGGSAALYLNGSSVATDDGFTIHPGDFKPDLNYIGKSQFGADPLFSGMIDDFRIFNYAVTQSELEALANNVPLAPSDVVATGMSGQVSLDWTASRSGGAVTYNVKRGKASGGPYLTVAIGVEGGGYVDSGLESYATYYYVISTVGSGGEGPDSMEASAITRSVAISDEEVASASISMGNVGPSTADLEVEIALSAVGHTYQVENSPDMEPGSWEPVGDARAGSDGVLRFTVPIATEVSARFYRIRINRQ